jgi:DNA-binding PadR family transcriptional regulator
MSSDPPPALRHVGLAPALLIAAQHANSSVSELVMTFRLNGLKGDRACRKLIYRLHRRNLLQVDRGGRDDRREKSIRLTDEARELLRDHMHSLGI